MFDKSIKKVDFSLILQWALPFAIIVVTYYGFWARQFGNMVGHFSKIYLLSITADGDLEARLLTMAHKNCLFASLMMICNCCFLCGFIFSDVLQHVIFCKPRRKVTRWIPCDVHFCLLLSAFIWLIYRFFETFAISCLLPKLGDLLRLCEDHSIVSLRILVVVASILLAAFSFLPYGLFWYSVARLYQFRRDWGAAGFTGR